MAEQDGEVELNTLTDTPQRHAKRQNYSQSSKSKLGAFQSPHGQPLLQLSQQPITCCGSARVEWGSDHDMFSTRSPLTGGAPGQAAQRQPRTWPPREPRTRQIMTSLGGGLWRSSTSTGPSLVAVRLLGVETLRCGRAGDENRDQ